MSTYTIWCVLHDAGFTWTKDQSWCETGMVLRSYNDGLDDRRRQDLYAYASAVIGTRALPRAASF